MTVRKLNVTELHKLTALFEYNDVEKMLAENTRNIENSTVDIYGLFDNDALIGELHILYESDNKQFAVRGRRVYLFAFRIHKDYQGKGCGKYLLESVLEILKNDGYSEFTVGVEDDTARAIHIYNKFGFIELLGRQCEEYQGDSYEYNLYLKR